MARITRHAQIILKQEALALDLLAAASKSDNVDLKMDLFEKVGKWVWIKNKLEDDGAGGIADYKRRLHAESSETDKRPTARRPQANGGAKLNAIKSRIPSSTGADADGNRGGSGGESAASAGGNGSVYPRLHGDTEPGAVPAVGHGDL